MISSQKLSTRKVDVSVYYSYVTICDCTCIYIALLKLLLPQFVSALT